MRLLTFQRDGESRIGVRTRDGVADLNENNASLPVDMVSLMKMGAGGLDAARDVVESAGTVYTEDSISIQAPVLKPEKIVCIGLNYAEHAAESNMEVPSLPVVFSKFPSALIGPGEPIVAPPSTNKLDYEVELVAVIGNSARNVSKDDALNYIAGYTVGHDVSARDYQLERPGGQWLLGKTFDSFAPLGPEIVTSDEIGDPHKLAIRCFVNGEKVQESSTEHLIFDLAFLVSHLSEIFTLSPGDLIFSWTPDGVGMGRDPQLWLKPGDEVVCEVDGIGRLTNPVA